VAAAAGMMASAMDDGLRRGKGSREHIRWLEEWGGMALLPAERWKKGGQNGRKFSFGNALDP
jgi:hypothetical protein